MKTTRCNRGAMYEKMTAVLGALHLSRDRERPILSWQKFASHAFSVLVLLFGISLFSHAGESAVQPEPVYRLKLYHTHTNQRIDIVYRVGDNYISSALDRLDLFLRDHRTGDEIQLDRRVFDLLHDLTAAAGRPDGEIDIICGYRTPWSNEFLRRTTQGVASHSLHIQGEAIDIRMPGVSTSQLRDVALTLHRGGVGYYPESRFVHVDVGRVRRW